MRHRKNTAPIREEDRLFFHNFVVEYEKYILYIARKFQKPGIQADDIAQEAKLRLMFKIPKLRTMNHSEACSYIFHTIQTSFLDLQRKENKHSHISLDSVMEEMVGIERDLVPDLFMNQALRRLRKGLSPKEWLALKSKYLYGYSQEELGDLLGMAPDSVRMFLCRVRKHAQEILSPEKVTGGDGND